MSESVSLIKDNPLGRRSVECAVGGVQRSALQADDDGGVGQHADRSFGAVHPQADPLRRRGRPARAGGAGRGRPRPRGAGPPRHLPAAGLGVAAREAPVPRATESQGRPAGGFPHRALQGLALPGNEVHLNT